MKIIDDQSDSSQLRAKIAELKDHKYNIINDFAIAKALSFVQLSIEQNGEQYNIGLVLNQYFEPFLELYNYFIDWNEVTYSNSKTENYLEDFKKFFVGKHLADVEKYEANNFEAEQQKATWFQGVKDSFEQSPDQEKYWKDDAYFSGYQHGINIFRNLVKESNKLFKVESVPKNKFVEEQIKINDILNKWAKKKSSESLDNKYTFTDEKIETNKWKNILDQSIILKSKDILNGKT